MTPVRNPEVIQAETDDAPATGFLSFWVSCSRNAKREDQLQLKRERIQTMTNVSVSLGTYSCRGMTSHSGLNEIETSATPDPP